MFRLLTIFETAGAVTDTFATRELAETYFDFLCRKPDVMFCAIQAMEDFSESFYTMNTYCSPAHHS